MIMTEIHAVIERHIIFMVRRWQELLIMVKDLLIRKGLLLSQDLLMGRNATVPLGPEIMYTWEHLWIANIQVQRMSISGMGFTV
jgi:hypothetical protein